MEDQKCSFPGTALSPTPHSQAPTAHEIGFLTLALEMTTLLATVVTQMLRK